MKVVAGYESEKILKKYVNISRNRLCQDVDDAVSFAKKFPLVLKIISKDALHKTEIKGLRIVHNVEDLVKGYGELLKLSLKLHISLEGILVQEFEKGTEVFIGLKNDPTFGHVIGLGIGGILVEEVKDVQWRSCPIKTEDAKSMLEELKFKGIIKGARNVKNNVSKLLRTLVKISSIPKKYPKLKEMDINPLILNEKSATVVDARMVFD